MSYLDALKDNTNFDYTENGAVKHNTTFNSVLDLFSLGGAYRNRTDDDIRILFGDAYRENKLLALKCLFYLRDVRGGQGERRFFRVAYKWLIKNDLQTAKRNLNLIPEFGRWDDLIDICFNTPAQDAMLNIIHDQLIIDEQSKTPSLLGKWMPSENASNKETKTRAKWFITQLGLTPKQYRQMLSGLRTKINIVEKLMSENRWDEIEFDKLPSVAGMRYRNAFAVKEVTAARYKAFMASKTTEVNAAVLNPVDIADKVVNRYGYMDVLTINTLQKYWDNLKDYYEGREENAIAVVDVSGSMTGTPMAAAIGMGAYVAEKSHGPFANHFITFSANPHLVEFKGDNIVDKMQRCRQADWGMNTNIEAVMDLLLDTAKRYNCSQKDMPARLYIFSDMEFDDCMTSGPARVERWCYRSDILGRENLKTLFESIQEKWRRAGYEMPQITFWNLDARSNNIPAIGDKFNYISGFSMSQMEAVMAGKTAVDMMLQVLEGERYSCIKVGWGGNA